MKKIALLFTILCADALNGMEQKSVTSDFQIYQLLSFMAKNDHQFYLPELIQIIATTACKITEERRRGCYRRYGVYICSVVTLVHFIEKRAESAVDMQSTVDILKICLQYSGKSLCTIQEQFNWKTALHKVVECGKADCCIDVLCQAAGEDLITFLCAQNQFGQTALHIAVQKTNKHVIEKLINIAHDRASELTATGDNGGSTPLDYAQSYLKNLSKRAMTSSELPCSDELNQMQLIVELLESYRSKEQ